MRNLSHALVAAAVLAMGGTQTAAQQAGGWVGQRVVLKLGADLKAGGQVVNDEKEQPGPVARERRIARVYTVEQTNGSWLWLAAEHEPGGGWARTSQVVPFDGAIDYYSSEIRAHPDHVGPFIDRGFLWHAKGNFDKAIADYNEAIRLDPRDAPAYGARGSAWHAKGEYDQALADYNEAIRLDPKAVLPYISRGDLWQTKADFDQAIADYDEAIRLDPRNAHAYEARGKAAWSCRSGEYDRAIADYNEAIRLSPRAAAAYRNRGLFLWW